MEVCELEVSQCYTVRPCLKNKTQPNTTWLDKTANTESYTMEQDSLELTNLCFDSFPSDLGQICVHMAFLVRKRTFLTKKSTQQFYIFNHKIPLWYWKICTCILSYLIKNSITQCDLIVMWTYSTWNCIISAQEYLKFYTKGIYFEDETLYCSVSLVRWFWAGCGQSHTCNLNSWKMEAGELPPVSSHQRTSEIVVSKK